MARFTPGPWKADIWFDEVRDQYDRVIFRIEPRGDGDEWMDEAQEIDNLRLIAAAPDLYEALEWIAGQRKERGIPDERTVWEMQDVARGALAKADGTD